MLRIGNLDADVLGHAGQSCHPSEESWRYPGCRLLITRIVARHAGVPRRRPAAV